MTRIAYYLVDENAIGGIQTHLVTLATAVAQLGHEVYALLPETAVLDPLVPPLAAGGVTVQRLPSSPVGRRARLRFLWRLMRRLRQLRPDVLHIQQSIPGHDRKAPLAARLAGVPVTMVTEHDYPRPQSRLRAWLRPLLVGMVDGVIAVSDHSRHLLTNHPYPPTKISVVYNGIQLQAFAPSAAAKRPFPHACTLGYLGRLEAHKGIDDLLHAAAALRRHHPQLQVLISGEGPERPLLEALTRTLGITEAVHFVGRMPDAAAFLRQLDIFVLPSRWEAFGLVAAEAMAVGVPVVVSNAGGLPEVVADGVTGLVVGMNDRPALVAAIDSLLRDPDLRRQMGEAGRQRVAAQFSAARMAADTVQLYHHYLQR